MTPFDRAVTATLEKEGVFSNHAADRGGATKYGITERVARANGYSGAMQDLTIEQAKSIYKLQYWDLLRLDEIADLSYAIAEEMFDTIVNGGNVGLWLQRALNAFNREQKDYPDLTADGRIGPVTVLTLREFLVLRGAKGERAILKALNSIQGERFIRLAENDPSQEAFAFGWFERVSIGA